VSAQVSLHIGLLALVNKLLN